MTGHNKDSLRQQILELDAIEFEALSCKEIAEKLGCKRESIQGTITGLVRKGLVFMKPHYIGKRKLAKYTRFPGAAKLIMSRPLASTAHLQATERE